MKNIAIIGIGRWGKNLIRDFSKITNVKICISNGKKENIRWVKQNYPKIELSKNLNDVLNDPNINSVIIATPIKTHYKIAKSVLLAKKNVFVEKPLTQNVKQTNELIKIAKKSRRTLFVGHVFLYNEIFSKMENIHKNEKILYANFQWKKLGTFDEDIFENLFSHDLSIMLELFGTPKKMKLNSKFNLITKIDGFSLHAQFKKSNCDILIDRTSNYKKKTIFFQTMKNSYIWDDNSLYKFHKKKNEYEKIFQSKITPLERECNEFVKIIKTNSINTDTAELAKKIIRLNSKISKKLD